MSLFDDLYYGNINISEREIEEGSDEKAALEAAVAAENALSEQLSEHLKPLLTNLVSAHDQTRLNPSLLRYRRLQSGHCNSNCYRYK